MTAVTHREIIDAANAGDENAQIADVILRLTTVMMERHGGNPPKWVAGQVRRYVEKIEYES